MSSERKVGILSAEYLRFPAVSYTHLDVYKRQLDDIDAIGVTYGPGLVGALLVGVAEAKAIAYARNIPLVGVHHIRCV